MVDELPAMGSADLLSLEAWSNLYGNILKTGRTSHVKPDDMDDEAWDGRLAELAEEDKVEERFRALSEQDKIPGLESAWTSKVVGDT